jgi:hypothetical protein
VWSREREPDVQPLHRAAPPAAPPANAVLTLQRSIGNRAVGRLLARDPLVCQNPGDLCIAPPEANACVVGDPSVATPPVPTTVLPTPPPVTPTPSTAAPGQPIVADVAIPVAFAEVVDDRKVKELTAGDFSGIAELKRFAGALAEEYLTRQRAATAYGKTTRAAIAAKLLKALQDAAKAGANAQADTDKLDKKARDLAVKAAIKAVAPPSDTDVDSSLATARDDQVKAFATSWDAHIASPQAPNLKVSTLANAWMRNRQQELLVVTETIKRATGQFSVWGRDALPGLAGFPEHLDQDATDGHSLSEAPGGTDGGKNARVHASTIKFLTSLRTRAPYATFQTYGPGHGSWPIAGRGLSIDCYIGGTDKARKINYGATTSMDFWERSNVAEFLDAIEETAKALDFRYFAIYNDFAVAKYVNEKATHGSVGFAGGLDKKQSLNYHGGGLKLHVHLDLVPPEMRSAPVATPPATP